MTQPHYWWKRCLAKLQVRGWVVYMLLGTSLVACQQVTIVVDKLPEGTNLKEKLYLTGNFNYWDPADVKYQLVQMPNGRLSVTFPAGWGTIEYKFTRGDFTTEEANSCGEPLQNRTLALRLEDTVRVSIESWKDQGLRNCQHVTMYVTPITPLKAGEEIYVAGNFNDWKAGEKQYQLKSVGKAYQITLSKVLDPIEYKFTRGKWQTEELDEYGKVIENRVFSFGTYDSLKLTIPFWKDRCKVGGDSLFLKVQIPASTPQGQALYVAGNFNGWNAANPLHKLHRIAPNVFAGSFPLIDPTGRNATEFKFTRGTWPSVESELTGRNRANRVVLHGVLDTLALEVVAWRDLAR